MSYLLKVRVNGTPYEFTSREEAVSKLQNLTRSLVTHFRGTDLRPGSVRASTLGPQAAMDYVERLLDLKDFARKLGLSAEVFESFVKFLEETKDPWFPRN